MSHRKEKRARRFVRYALMTAVSFDATCATHALLAAEAATTRAASAKQGTDADQLSEIVVTGFRESLQNALNIKRESNLPVEVISAEDIGKMPDQNVAESLQRLAGIQIDRGPQGEGTQVLIDGLRQNLTTLNGDLFLTGREFYVSGEGSGGGAGGNSQYGSLEGVPSELVTGINVFKNPDASMTEGGLGGTIELRTRDPLAGPEGLTLGGNFRESTAEGTSSKLPAGVLVGSYKLSDRIGFTASVSFDNEKTHTKEFQDQNRAAWLTTNSATGPYTGALTSAGLTTLPNGQYYIDPQLAYFSDVIDYRNDKGASLGVKARITDSITSRLSWFHSEEDDTSYTYSDKAWFNGSGQSPGNLIPGIDPTQPYSIDANGVVQNATFNANGAETATLYQRNNAKADNFQWVTRFDNGGPVRGVLDAAYAHATSDFQAAQADVEHGLYLTNTGVATSPSAPGCNNGSTTCAPPAIGNHGYEFTYANGGTSGLPSISYLSPYSDVLNNPAYTTFKSNWAWANFTNNKQFSVRGALKWNPRFIKDVPATVSVGLRFAGRSVDQTFGRYLINGSNPYGRGGIGAGTAAGNCCLDPAGGPWLYYQDPGYANIPYSTAASNPGLVATFPNFAAGNIIVKNPASGGMSNPATYLQQVWAGAGVTNATEQFFVDQLSSFRVAEHTTAPYFMVDLGGPESSFHSNFGVRVVTTNLTINNGQSALSPTYYGTASWNGVDSNVVPVRTTRSYTDVLPSFNFVLDLSDSQKIRLSAARVVAPQDLFQLGVGNSYNFTRNSNRVNPTTGQVGGFEFINGASGNTQLDPYRASQFYLSYEDYFAPGSIASVAGFYKQVDNFIEVEQVSTFVKDDFGGDTGYITKPVNAGQGKIYGIEVNGDYAFGSNLAPWLRGLGVAANYTYSKSEANNSTTSFSYDSAIPGVALNAFNGTVYYERFGFSARMSYTWRDRAVNDSLVGATFTFPDQAGVEKTYQVFSAPYGQLDGQIGYDFNEHVGVFASVQNLSNSVQHTYLQFQNLPFTYDASGRRFFFGIRGKL